jgi:hypothetical protein
MNVGRDQGDFTGMIGACERTPNMTLLKILAILLVAGGLGFLALPGFAASDHDGVTGPFAKPSNSGAKPRRHRRHDGTRQPHRPRKQNGSPQAPAPQRTYYGGTEIG